MGIVELSSDDGVVQPGTSDEAEAVVEPRERERPNVSGDLPSLFRTAPMFRRAVAGYDRFQVDTYVEWAEDELATADREREHLVARHLSTRAALDEARLMLAHSAGGGELLQLSRRIGSMLAVAADEAESMRGEAAADRSAAAAAAQRMAADAERALAVAEAEVERLVREAAREVEAMSAEAGRMVDEAERTGSEARVEAEARLQKVRLMEKLAVERAAQIRQQAGSDAAAALARARDEVVRMLSTGRDERRRADAAAAAARELLERDLAARRTALRAEVAALEQRRAHLLAEVETPVEPVARTAGRPLDRHLRELRERPRWRSRSLRTP